MNRSAMMELWQVALGLMIFCFGAWFELERTFGPKARNMKKRLLLETSSAIVEIYNREHENISEESLKKIASLYEKSEVPVTSLENTVQVSLASGIMFLITVTSRLAIDYLDLSEITSLEGLTFAIGFFMLLMMIYNFCTLRKLVSSEKDPPSISILAAAVVCLLLGVNAFFIWILIPIVTAGRATLDLLIFLGLLFLSFPGAAIFLWAFTTESRWRWVGYLLFASPWICLAVVSIIARFFS